MAGRGSGSATRKLNLAQLYLDAAPVIILVINNEGIVTEINRRGYNLLGYPKNEIVGRNWFDNFIPRKIRNNLKAKYRQMLSGSLALEHYENPVITASGEERIIIWHNILLRDPGGNIVGSLSSGEDATEKQRIQEELNKYRDRLEESVAQHAADYSRTSTRLELALVERQQAEKSLILRSALLDKAPEPIFVFDLKGNIIFVNDVAGKFFGFERSELIGMSIYQIVQPQVKSILEAEFKKLPQEREQKFETYFIRKDGSRLPMLIHHAIIDTPEGQYVLGISHDISRQTELEKDLRISELSRRLLLSRCCRLHAHSPPHYNL